MDNVEIEIQVKIEKKENLIAFLKKNGEFKSEKHQIDEYFSPIHRNFINIRPVEEWLRIRDSQGKYSMNYKNWHYDKQGKSNYCDEYETEIKDPENMKKILLSLDFKSLVKVDKLREIWTYKDYEISLDSINGLGDFVEIEYKGKNGEADPKKTTKQMINFLKEIGCGKIERNYLGYPFQLLFPEEIRHEEQ